MDIQGRFQAPGFDANQLLLPFSAPADFETDSVDRRCKVAARALGAPRYLLAIGRRAIGDPPIQYCCSNFPTHFLQAYQASDMPLFEIADEVGGDSGLPCFWQDLNPEREPVRQLLRLAESCGLNPAATFPLYGRHGVSGVFIVSGDGVTTTGSGDPTEFLREGQHLTRQLFDHALKLLPPANLTQPLSTRQLSVLNLIARGQSIKQIALSLVISPRTAKGHLEQCLIRLQVPCREQAILKAHSLGLLTLS